jgi:hypothetical protein
MLVANDNAKKKEENLEEEEEEVKTEAMCLAYPIRGLSDRGYETCHITNHLVTVPYPERCSDIISLMVY